MPKSVSSRMDWDHRCGAVPSDVERRKGWTEPSTGEDGDGMHEDGGLERVGRGCGVGTRRRSRSDGEETKGDFGRDPSKRGDGGAAYRSGVGSRMEGGRSQRRQSRRQRGQDVGRIVGDGCREKSEAAPPPPSSPQPRERDPQNTAQGAEIDCVKCGGHGA